MSRAKGSKNKTTDEKIQDIIEEVKALPVSEEAKAEAIDEIDDLLGSSVEIKGGSTFLGYHPITGDKVWN